MILYHRIADKECAAVRKFLVERMLTDQIDFKNIDINEKGRADLESKNGGAIDVPALWTGTELLKGLAAIERHFA